MDSLAQAERLAERLDGLVRRFKIGSQLFTAGGPAVVEAIQKRGAEVFLDLKFHDIPNTVAGRRGRRRASVCSCSMSTPRAAWP